MANLEAEGDLNLILGNPAERFCSKWPDMVQTAPILIMCLQVGRSQFGIPLFHQARADKSSRTIGREQDVHASCSLLGS